MIPVDYLQGSYEFETELLPTDDGKWRAKALGYESVHGSRDQALNDLNAKLNEEIEKGNLIPTMGT